MIRTNKIIQLAGNQPQIIHGETWKHKRKEKDNSIEAAICLNCKKSKCSGTQKCFERMKSND